MRVLLIEDNVDLAANIGEFFEARGHRVECGRDGQTGLELARRGPYDALVLDIGLPGVDGLSLCRQLRTDVQPDLPVLFLTARDTEGDKLAGFAAGADDYVVKPFSLLELLARLQVLVRRTAGRHEILRVADLAFDVRALVIQRGSRAISLAPIGMRILTLLMRASPGLVTKQQLERAVWGNAPPGSDTALRAHILLIRSAIDTTGEPKLLHTVHGSGYRLASRI